jgi:hypothetical protein
MPSEATVKIALFMSSPRVWQEFSISFFPHNNYDAIQPGSIEGNIGVK